MRSILLRKNPMQDWMKKTAREKYKKRQFPSHKRKYTRKTLPKLTFSRSAFQSSILSITRIGKIKLRICFSGKICFLSEESKIQQVRRNPRTQNFSHSYSLKKLLFIR
ncbi:hypothetical protein DLM78_17130 [Leptospira stimsonii]|uniref:Uncharacterized protein n=1 Tax=Leptospira stimsonii TaxID=2202203 RepID=A0A8B3CMV0_9LEPT|nr:hypothetical protein DLM78_17130 [Leptospira stimsonii]